MTSNTSESELLEQVLPSASDSHSDSLLLSSESTKDKLRVQLRTALFSHNRVRFVPFQALAGKQCFFFTEIRNVGIVTLGSSFKEESGW